MQNKKNPEMLKREQLAKESMDLVLKRGGVTKKVLLEDAMHQFFAANYKELLTPAEIRKYSSVIL